MVSAGLSSTCTIARAASRTWTYGRQNCSPKTTSSPFTARSRVNSFTVKSKRILGVERDRPELDRLVGDRIPVDPSVVAAGRGEDEALDTRLLGIVEQLPGAVDVDLHCELRLASARRIA